MRSPTRRGLTLLEQMVVCGLLSLVLALAFSVLQPCLVDWKILQDRSDMERSASLAGERMSRDMTCSSADSLTVIDNPPAVSFLVPSETGAQGYDPVNGTPMWDHFVIYYLDASNQILYRKTWPGPGGAVIPPYNYTLPSTTVFRLSTAELQLAATTTNGSERRFVTLIDGLQVQTDAQVTVLQMQFSVQTRRGTDHLTRRVALRMRND